jgi:hypothetical protein
MPDMLNLLDVLHIKTIYNYANCGYHTNELSTVNTLCERKLRTRRMSRTKEKPFISMFRVNPIILTLIILSGVLVTKDAGLDR